MPANQTRGHGIGHKYPLPPREADAVCLIGQHQGCTAAQFSALFWPHLKKAGRWNPALLAAEFLCGLRRKRILRRRIEPTNFYRGGTEKPTGHYYLTDYGYGVYEYWERQRRR